MRFLLLAGVAMVLAACNATARQVSAEERLKQEQETAKLAGDRPPTLLHYYRSIVVDGRKDAVLNWMRLGKEALDMGRVDVAGEAFDQALAGIETVYADNPEAEKARSVWNKEAVKDFKGEPYERAMAYYYRGLVYLMTGDLDNARASFKGAMLQDSFAENERHRADFAPAAFLEGWTNRCSGTATQAMAQEKFDEAHGARSTLTPPDPSDRLLVVMEVGQGPSKEGVGQYKEKLAFRERTGPRQGYRVRIGEQDRPLRLAENLFFQATTRGGREMDKILAIKADTKQATAAVGTGVAAVGLGVMAASQYQSNSNNRNTAMAAGLAVALVGALAQAAAQSMTPEADVRYWWQLPHSIFIATLPAVRIASPDAVDVLYENGERALRRTDVTRLASVGGCTLAWIPALAIGTDRPREAPADSGKAAAPAQPDGKPSPKPAARTTRVAKGKEVDPVYGTCRAGAGAVLNVDAAACKALNGTVLSPEPAKG